MLQWKELLRVEDRSRVGAAKPQVKGAGASVHSNGKASVHLAHLSGICKRHANLHANPPGLSKCSVIRQGREYQGQGSLTKAPTAETGMGSGCRLGRVGVQDLLHQLLYRELLCSVPTAPFDAMN